MDLEESDDRLCFATDGSENCAEGETEEDDAKCVGSAPDHHHHHKDDHDHDDYDDDADYHHNESDESDGDDDSSDGDNQQW